MIVIICAKYKRNPSSTVDATERTRFSKSRSNDLEDIGQGQRSSHSTHLLMLVIICTKYGKNPSWTVDAAGRTGKVNGQTDRQTDRQGESNIPPLTSLRGVYYVVALAVLNSNKSDALGPDLVVQAYDIDRACGRPAPWIRPLGPVLLLRDDAVTRILSNGSAAFIEICAAICWNSCGSITSL